MSKHPISELNHKSRLEEILNKLPNVKDKYGICPSTTRVVDYLVIGADPINIIDQLLFVNARAQDQLQKLILETNK